MQSRTFGIIRLVTEVIHRTVAVAGKACLIEGDGLHAMGDSSACIETTGCDFPMHGLHLGARLRRARVRGVE